jgi:hypothetical protein
MHMRAKAPVTERALIARINRKLKTAGRVLRVKRGNWRNDISGPYYLVDVKNNTVVAGASAANRIDLEKFARKLGTLEEYEEIVESEE